MTETLYTYKYPRPAVTTDVVVFSYYRQQLRVLLIERGREPFLHCQALPGGFLEMEETAEQCAARELREETGVTNAYLQQIGAFSGVERDPRGRVISIAFFATIRTSDHTIAGGDDALRADWFCIDELPPLAFDHAGIICKAREALQSAAITKAAAFSLLDKTFTVDELQQLLEVIYGRKYDSEHFRQQILSAGFIEPADGASDRHTFNPLKHEAFIRQRQRSEDLPFVH